MPRHVFHFPEECKVAFLYGLFRGDGSVGKNGRQYLGSASRQLLNDVSYLCSMLGVNCSLYAGRPSEKVIAGKRTSSDGVHRLYVGRWDFTADGRLVEVARHAKGLPETSRLVPVNGSLYAGLTGQGYQGVRYHKTVSLNVVGRKAPELLNEIPALKRLHEADLCLLEVEAVEPVEAGYGHVYDVSVPGLENFIAGWQPICLHNSTIEGGMVCTNNADFYETVRDAARSRDGSRAGLRQPQERVRRRLPRPEPRVHLRPRRLQRAQHRDQRGHRPLAAAPARRRHPPADRESAAVPGQPRQPGLPHRLRDRGEQQLRASPWSSASRTRTCASASWRRCGPTAWSSAAARLGVAIRCASRTCAGCSARTSGRSTRRADHVHFYGFYIGNYPSLERERILWLCELLNGLVI